MSQPTDPPDAKKPPGAPAGVERRSTPRRPLYRECLVRPEGGGSGAWHGVAYDISSDNIGVALPLPVRPGSVLLIEPWGSGSPPVRAEVLRSAVVSSAWLHGCKLTCPLNPEELGAWVSG